MWFKRFADISPDNDGSVGGNFDRRTVDEPRLQDSVLQDFDGVFTVVLRPTKQQ